MFGRLFRRKSSTRQSPDSTSKECAMTNTLMGNATPSTTTTTPHEDVQSYAQVLTPHHKRLNGTINTVTQESEDEEHREMVLPMAMSATFASTYDGRNVAAPEEASASITPPPTTPTDPPKAPYMVTLRALYRYATPRDHLLLALGCLLSIANGALYPTMALLFGQAISQFRPTVNMDGIEHVAISYLIIALALFLTDYGAHVCFQLTAERQMQALRLHCFQHVLYKELAWFEAGNASQTTHHLSVTTLKMKQGMGIKLGDVLRCIAQFVSGYAIGFRSHWGVSMVMASVMPLMAFCLSWIIKTLRTRAIRTQKKYMEAGAIAEETLQAMRTVTSFNGFDRAVRLYVDKVRGAEMESITLARVLSMALGLFFGTIWITYAVGLWYGGRLVANVEINPKTVFTAFYGILIGTISLAQISPNLAAVINAKAAATALYAILDQPSTISAQDTTVGIVPSSTKGFGVVPGQCMGKIEVINVDFAYPSRPETMVLKDYSVTIHAGETVAFVGPSGSGKSTLVALLQRLYDPTAGRILLDGHDLQLLQLKWLRQQIGIVSQEPVLFATTIFDNIAAALVGETETKLAAAGDDPAAHEAWKNEVRRRVEAAATLAHAHTFIKSLPHGYETFVGEKGVALSGGQKQRIAIARALVRDPRILILDEATSALDTESEAVIQEAFDSIMQRQKTTYDPSEGVTFTPRTTIVIAHRLSTIRQAHRICVVVDGSIVESGTHEELISIEQGHFVQLVQTSLADTLDGTATGRPASLLWNEATQQVVESALNRESSVAMLERPTSKPLRDESIGPLSSSTTPSLSIVSVPRPVLFSTTTTIAELHYGQDIEASAITVKSEVPMAGDDHSDPLAEDDTMVGTSRSHSPPCSLRRLMQYNRPERCLYIIGLFASMLNGLSFPASAVLLSAIVSIMVNKHAAFYVTHDVRYLNELYDQVRLYSIAYIAGAIGLVAINFVQSYTFKYMAEKITTRLRTVHFKALCRQDIAYFDDPRHGSGALAGDLAALSTQAAILAGDAQGRVMQAATTFVAALMVSFLMGSWLLSFIMMIVFPLLILANITRTNQVKGAKGSGDQAEDDTARANALASESVTHIRTVAAFGLERTMVDKFKQLSIFPMRQASKEAHIQGIMLGFSSFITYAVYALVFWYGGTLVHVKRITFNELIRSLMAIMISANGIGQATSHLAEVDAGKRAAVRIFELEDRENSSTRAFENDPANEFAAVEGGLVLSGAVGAIEFRNIHFTYPTRPDAKVLKDLNLMIEPGQFVALCGPSGGGKSTLIALLERFYEPTAGCIYLDGVPIRALNVQWLRSQIGLIAQEPVLFAGTVYENIAYGCLGNQEELADGEEENEMSRLTCTREQVERAAELANAHGFITSLSNGYDTYIGGSGEQLSGGQKQRIAIARAILKAPAILLLDEATSALDAESEQLVQDALERVIKMKRRTTLVIAHRMRTIRHAHKICVIANGSIVEQGSHEELVRLQGGMYAKLVESSTDERYSMMERPSIDRMSLASFA